MGLVSLAVLLWLWHVLLLDVPAHGCWVSLHSCKPPTHPQAAFCLPTTRPHKLTHPSTLPPYAQVVCLLQEAALCR